MRAAPIDPKTREEGERIRSALDPRLTQPTVVVVMGVSGSGKTTIAEVLAAALDWNFLEGDDLHPPANVEKMRSGTPLDDDDRNPWLQAIAREIDAWRAAGQSGVVTCSALKRAYRDIVAGDRPDVVILYLKGSRELIAARVAARHHRFMPSKLLDSQFATLEEPGADENAIVVSVEGTPSDAVERAIKALIAREQP